MFFSERQESLKPSVAELFSKRILSLGQILRVIGVVALVGAATTFLVQRWGVSNDIQRYFGLLGMTVALPFLALLCGIGLREGRGARVFLGALLSIAPVHFGVLGGLLYSQFQFFSPDQIAPAYALWVASSPQAALATAGVALAALLPLIAISFTTLARSQARTLTVYFALANVALLVPCRHAEVIAAIAWVLVAALLYVELRLLRSDAAMSTQEGIWARLLLPVPVILLVVRQLHLYGITRLFTFAIWTGLAAGLFAAATVFSSEARVHIRRASVVPLSLAWWTLTSILAQNFGWHAGSSLLFFGLAFAATLVTLTFFERNDGTFYWSAAAAIAGVTASYSFLISQSLVASLACLAISIAYFAVGFVQKHKGLLIVGLVGAAGSLVYHVHAAIKAYQWAGWAGLALLGVVVIIAASLLEKFHGRWAQSVPSSDTEKPVAGLTQ